MSGAGLPPLREVIRRQDLRARKSLGQNYILDLSLLGRIARAAGPLAGSAVLEIGAGPGGLTRALLDEGAAQVTAIERDRRFAPALAEIAAAFPGRCEFVIGDALALAPERFAAERGHLRIAGNLPFNIASALIGFWLGGESWPPVFSSITVAVQREAGERITAAPGGRDYGFLSVLCGWRARARILFSIPAQAFRPQPAVDACILRLEPLPRPRAPASLAALREVASAVFSQRRKMLRNSLRTLTPDSPALLAQAGIDPGLRPEQLPVEAFCALARVWEAAGEA